MSTTLRRLVAVGIAAAVALLGFTPLSTATAATAPDATRAANYLVRNLPSAKDGAGASINVAMGLAAVGGCSYAPSLRTLVTQIEKNAKAYLYPGKQLNQSRAANLAIAVKSLGLNPKKFAGYNLVSLITKSLPADGRIGGSESAFSQSLGIIALKRSGATIPVTLLTKLLSLQDDSGAFGYEFSGFNADPDTTAMGILALKALGELDPQLDAALDWATDNQTADGYWENYSPVDSTGLLGSALQATGADVTAAKNWLGEVQRSDGGFPNSLQAGATSNLSATANALSLITGKSLLDVSVNLSKCPKNPTKLPAATSSCAGVWVVVDRGNGQDTVRCATKYATGLKALASAGMKVKTFQTNLGPSICQIHSYPYTCDTTFATGYWSYWQATQNPDGTWTDWDYATTGPGGSTPAQGTAEGHLWVPAGTPEDAAVMETSAPRGYSTTGEPTVSGLAKVGETLTVDHGTWTPTPEFATRWYRNGKSISGATKETYKLTKSDVGKTITVKVTASGRGLQTVSKTSAPTAKVVK